jgi:hypothetical protein
MGISRSESKCWIATSAEREIEWHMARAEDARGIAGCVVSEQPVQCWNVRCDECDYVLDMEGEGVEHFTDPPTAATRAAEYGWEDLAEDSPGGWLCNECTLVAADPAV